MSERVKTFTARGPAPFSAAWYRQRDGKDPAIERSASEPTATAGQAVEAPSSLGQPDPASSPDESDLAKQYRDVYGDEPLAPWQAEGR
jgi:hypothetical protein